MACRRRLHAAASAPLSGAVALQCRIALGDPTCWPTCDLSVDQAAPSTFWKAALSKTCRCAPTGHPPTLAVACTAATNHHRQQNVQRECVPAAGGESRLAARSRRPPGGQPGVVQPGQRRHRRFPAVLRCALVPAAATAAAAAAAAACCNCAAFVPARTEPSTLSPFTLLQELAAAALDGFCVSHDTPLGRLAIRVVQAADVGPASVLLTRAFATSAQGVPLQDGRAYVEACLRQAPLGVLLVARLVPNGARGAGLQAAAWGLVWCSRCRDEHRFLLAFRLPSPPLRPPQTRRCCLPGRPAGWWPPQGSPLHGPRARTSPPCSRPTTRVRARAGSRGQQQRAGRLPRRP